MFKDKLKNLSLKGFKGKDLKSSLTNSFKFLKKKKKNDQADPELVRQIASTFNQNLMKGASEEVIYNALVNKGYEESLICAGLDMYHEYKKQMAA